MDILIKAAIVHHKRRLNLFLTTFTVKHPRGFYEIENLQGHLENKWNELCEGTKVKIYFLYSGDDDRKEEQEDDDTYDEMMMMMWK